MGINTKQQYRLRAIQIGDNAVRLVEDFFKQGIADVIGKSIGGGWGEEEIIWWTVDDLDRALSVMSGEDVK